MFRLAFIGAGNMTTSMITGLVKKKEFGTVLVSDRNPDKLELLEHRYKTETAASNVSAAELSDVLILAVKPQGLQSLCTEIRQSVQKKKPLIISVAAGIETDAIESWLGGNLSVVRTMPNIPSSVQEGMTGLYANPAVSPEEKQLTEKIFDAIGEYLWVEQEQDIHAITAVSGSGPAYYFMFMEAMQKSAESLGLDAESALRLVAQTAYGAAKMVKEGNVSPEDLRKSVMSPNGTTEQAIRSFEQDGLRTAVQQAMIACLKRSEAMAEELSGKE